jgi:hypothetical protein
MKIAYIEPSVINRAACLDCPVDRVRKFVVLRGFEPATGLHTVYELARTFISGDPVAKARGQKLFSILRDLGPIYQPEPGELLRCEVEKLRRGTPVVPSLEPRKVTATQEEVVRLADGMLSDWAQWFITEVERVKERELKAQEDHLVHINLFREADQSIRALRTFDDVWAYFERHGQLPQLFFEVLRGAVSQDEAKELAAAPFLFPAITAAARANTYLNFIMISNVVRPGKDKLDDYKHCFEASYCDAFVTADTQQETAMKVICPNVSVLNWNDDFKRAANPAPAADV